MLIDLSYLRDLLRTEVEDRLDHKNLNLDVAELQGVNPTVENICFLIWKLLRARLDEQFDLQVRLYETPRNWAEYPA